ncbi:hypothetical protein [Viridibacillus sp. FSL H8-0110]|uniref:hypothetical protein n=1 Tax=Viridibacillus sp. FSL H8-0110 TaxID=2921376 RepID=UPI0030F70324
MDLKRAVIEIILPIMISYIIIAIYFYFSSESLVSRISKIYSNISTVIAIQIGFIITSLALIASFGENAGKKAFSEISDNEIYLFMDKMIASFVYNVIIYMSLLMLGFLHLVLIEPIFVEGSNFKINIYIMFILKEIYLLIWSFLIIHGFMVFLRNIKLIQLYLLSVLKK